MYLYPTNNTKAIAEIIHNYLGGTLVSLELEKPYPENYQATLQQVVNENETGYLPLEMKNVIILGAGGNIAKHVIDILIKRDDINLTLFLRNKNRLRNKDVSKCRIIEDDVLNYDQLKNANAA